MGAPIRILHLDDNPLDAQLVAMTLEIEQDKILTAVTYVQSKEEFLSAVERRDFDIILSDYRMPGFDGDQALKVAQKMCPDIPFIMVTGELGEDLVIETLKRGATDYVLKDRIFRLVPAIERALAEAENQRKRREAEESLRQSQQTLTLAVAATKLGLFDHYPQTGRLIWNDVAKEHFGLSPEATVTYEVFISGLHPDDRKRVQEAIGRVLSRKGGEYHIEYRTIGLDDRKERWLNARGQAFFDESGRAVRFIGATTDITAVKQSQAEIRKAHRETEETLNSVQDPFYALDGQWRFTYVNARAEEFLEKRHDELLGKTLWDCFPQLLGSESEGTIKRAMKERIPAHFEVRSRITGVWLDVHAFPKADGGLSVLYRDISERKNQEQAIRLSEERFAAAFHMSPYPQVVSRVSDGVFIDANAALLAFYGMSREEVIGHSSFEIGILADPGERRNLVEILQRDGKVHGFKMHIKTRHQGERLVLLSVSLLKASEEETMLTVVNDITERNQVEEELRKANERMEIILHGAADGFIIYDGAFRFSYIGQTSAERFRRMGRDPGALRGKVLWEEFPEFSGSETLAKMQDAMTRRMPLKFEVSFRERWFSTRCVPTSDGGLAVLSVDISEGKKVQERLKESEELSRLALAAGEAGAWSWDLRTNALRWSNDFYRVFGFEPGSIEPDVEAGLARVHPEDQHRMEVLLEEVLTSGESVDEVHRIVWPDGSVHWVREMTKAFFDSPSDSKPSRLVGLAIDVSEQKATEERLQQLNQDLERRNHELDAEQLKWQKLIEGMADEVWACDAGGKMSMLNLATKTAMGLTEFKGKALEEVLQEVDILRPDGSVRPAEEAPLLRSLEGEVARGEEIMRHRTTGTTCFRQYSSAPVRDAEGAIVGAVAIVRDITEARKAESEIRKFNEELEERVRRRTAALERANQELESFSYSVSHDLKAPLRVIDGFARLIADPHNVIPPDKQLEYLSHIQSSTEQMGKLIESLLAFARVSRQVPQKVRVDMRSLAEQTVREQRQILGGDASRARVTIGEMPPEANGDPVLLKQVFANLLGNAFKFTRKQEEPSIEIGGYRRNGDLVYFVRDNGIGFPSTEVEKLFQVFQRLHAQEDFEGTGIGLANVRKIVERHGGEVCAEGEEGKGATFYFALPAAA